MDANTEPAASAQQPDLEPFEHTYNDALFPRELDLLRTTALQLDTILGVLSERAPSEKKAVIDHLRKRLYGQFGRSALHVSCSCYAGKSSFSDEAFESVGERLVCEYAEHIGDQQTYFTDILREILP